MCDHAVWDAQIEALSDIVEARSMEWGEEHTSLVKMAEAVLATAPEKFALAGHSMGGRVAFEVYRLAPQRLTRLAVMNTGTAPLAEGDAGASEERDRRRLLDIAFKQGLRAMAMEWLKGMIPDHRITDQSLVNAIIGMFERKTPELFLIQQEALLARPDARPVLPQIHCPTLVLTGEDDKWSGPARHEEIAASIPGSQLVLVPKCGHMSTMERPKEVSAAMRAWITN
jgi:pimeloyl-ACP methyl ester carboxylesterase